MITEEDYRHQKQNEIDCLSRFTSKSYPLKTASPDEVYAIKSAIKTDLLKQAVDKLHDWSETNCTPYAGLDFQEQHFTYTYQRDDLQANPRTLFEKTYQLPLPHTVSTTGFYTNCGMSALSSILFSITSAYPDKYQLYYDSDTYFETRLLIKKHTPSLLQHPPSDTKQHLYVVDSSAPPDIDIWLPKIKASSNTLLPIVILDTTCYPLQSDKIRHFITTTLQADVLLILVRSHEKLDFMGLEYSRLGSVHFLYNNDFSLQAKAQLATLIENFQETVSLIGLNFNLMSIPPFLANKEFHDINNKRVAAAVQNNAQASKSLHDTIKNTPFSIKQFEHNLFFCINFKNNLSSEEVLTFMRNLIQKLSKGGVAARGISSFGFDFVGLAHFSESSDDKLLRICLPDLPTHQVEKFTDITSSALGQLSKNDS